jgi:transposase-like protein
MLHHIIAPFRKALHHTSYRINNRLSTKQIFGNNLMNESVLRHKANLRQIQFYQENLLTTVSHNRFAIKGPLSLRSMKRREGVFSPKAQKWYVRKFHALQRNILH